MGDIFIYIITGICLLAPYGYFGQDTVNGILFLIISMFSLLFVKRIKGNKVYLLAYILMVLAGVISLFNSSLTIESIQGLSLYFSGLMLYIAFTFYKEKEGDIIKISTYIIAISALYYVVIQGSILNGGVLQDRIDGNIGYANSYALIMLIGLYFNKIREENSIKEMLDIIFITGLLFTGSRNSLLYLGIFVIIDIILCKKEKGRIDLSIIFNIIISLICYVLIEKIGLAIVIVLPILFIIYYNIKNDKYLKAINIITIISVPIGLITLFVTNNNLITRISEISLKSNEFQLRIGYLEDVFNFIKINPMGGGINTYMYNQGSFQTGYYDVRYVHNSFGQALYDMGWLGLIAFIILFLVGIFVILKGNNQKKYIYLALYLTVYFHSILDFDFAYLFTFLVLAIILAFNGKDDFELKINSKLINIPIVIIGVYIGISSFFLFMANKNYKDGNYNVAIKYADIIDKITVSDNLGKDIKLKSHIAQLDIVQIQKDINSIINDFGPNKRFAIYLDIARGYKILNNTEKASEYYEKTLELQKYNKYFYDEYSSIYKEDSQEAKDIMDKYNYLMDNRSNKSKERFK